MDTLLKIKDDKVSGDASRLEVLMERAGCRLWTYCMATLMLAGNRHHGRPRGLDQAFPPSHFSLLVRGFTDA